MKRNYHIAGKAVSYLIIALALVFTLFPLFYLISASFKTNAEIMVDASRFFPQKLTLDNYIQAWNSEVFNVKRLVWNSVYYSAVVVAVTTLTSSVAGYVFARGHFRGMKFWFAAFTALMFINFGGANIVPLLNIVKGLGLNGSLNGLIVVKAFSINVVNIYLVKGYVESLPKEMDEAAVMDGCGFAGIFFRIIAPLLKPILATVAILGFQGSWNEYLMPMVFTLTDPSKGTLISGLFALKSSSQAATNWNLMLAGSVIAVVPVVIVYLFLNKFFISGLAAGAVKG